MLGNFISRALLLGIGYAYPAFQCFKVVEKKNSVGIHEHRFWCQYWIIMALVIVAERSADFLISWLPFYGELKLGLVVYLLNPKFSGTGRVYDTMLRPFLAKHENDIDRTMSEMRAKGQDMAIFYWQYVAEFAQTVFLQGLSNRLPRIKTSTEEDSTRVFGLKELSATGSARSMPDSLVSSDAETNPNSQTDFIYVEEHKPEEDPRRHPHNLDHKSPPPPPPPDNSDTTDANKDDFDIDCADLNATALDGPEHADGLKHRLHLRGFRQRRSAAE